LDRWLLSPDPFVTIGLLGDSIFQGTVGHADAFPNRLARGIGGLRSVDVVSSGAGFYPCLRSGSQTGAASTGYEWWRSGTWTVATALSAYDLALNNSWQYWASSPAKRRLTADVATTSASFTMTSASGAFAAADVGCLVNGPNIPAHTVIAKINSTTSVELSQRATATASGQTVDIMGTTQTWTRPLSAYPQQRTRFDAVTNGTTTLTSTSADFTSYDVGAYVAGTNIPSGTTIAAYVSESEVTLSAAATGSTTDGLLMIGPSGGRLVSDLATTNASAVVTSATAAFTPNDVGTPVSGTNIKNDSTIVSVQSATQATLSQTAQATSTNSFLNIGTRDAPPIAELEIITVGTAGLGTGYSYSVDGGTNWVSVTPTGAGSSPAKLYRTVVATTNPVSLILRAQTSTSQNGATSAFMVIGVGTNRVASATQGVKVLNLATDGDYLKKYTREHNLGVTTAATLDSTTSVTGLTGLPTGTNRITGDGIPDGTTITYVSATAGTLSQAATLTGTSNVSVFKTAGDSYSMLDNTAGSGTFDPAIWYGWRPQLIIVGFSNDLIDHATKFEGDGYVNMLRDLKNRTDDYADLLVFIDYEQGGSRLDGTQCTATIQATFRTKIRAWCVEAGVAYFDCYTAFATGEGATGYAAANTAGLMADTLHLSQQGANAVAARLRRALTIQG